jgi:hypothetical protein
VGVMITVCDSLVAYYSRWVAVAVIPYGTELRMRHPHLADSLGEPPRRAHRVVDGSRLLCCDSQSAYCSPALLQPHCGYAYALA